MRRGRLGGEVAVGLTEELLTDVAVAERGDDVLTAQYGDLPVTLVNHYLDVKRAGKL